MPRSITGTAQRVRERLTRLDHQPLAKAALVVILFLDIFILGTIIDGLDNHTRQLASPDEIVPPLCRESVIEASWSPTNRLQRLAQLVTLERVREPTPEARAHAPEIHALCAPIISAYAAIRENDALATRLEQWARLSQQVRSLNAAQAQTKDTYDTRLLEQIATRPQPGEKVTALRKESAKQAEVLENLVTQQRALAAEIEENPRVAALYAHIEGITEADRANLRKDSHRLEFWFPAKRLGMDMLFLLPLVGVFYFWNDRSIRAHRPLQTLVSSHLLVVASIPVVLRIGELVLDIIPRKLLRQLIEFLESWKLVAIWDYLVIATAIMAALALIYLLQRKLFSRERLLQRRIAKGLCQACGLPLPPGSRHCPACGSAQFRACAQCGQPMHVHARYCMACGQSSSDNRNDASPPS